MAVKSRPFEGPRRNKRKMESNVIDHCRAIIENIKSEMGKVERQLESNMYITVEAFVADVRQIFSHATLKQVETEPKNVNPSVKQGSFVDEVGKTGPGHYVKKQTVLEKKNCQATKLFDLNKVCIQKSTGVKKSSGNVQLGTCRPKVRKTSDDDQRGVKKRKLDGCLIGTEQRVSAFVNRKQSHDSDDLSSEISSGHDHNADSKQSEEKNSSSINESISGENSGGSGVVAIEKSEHSYLSTPDAAASSGESRTLFNNIPMSPNKALRVAMLKSRFADTILRAAEYKDRLLDHGRDNNSDSAKTRHERERLENEQRVADLQKTEQENKKRQRETERKAARMAVEKIEKSVEIEDNLASFKDLMMLCSSTREEFGTRRPLERFGLFLKEDYLDEEDEDAILAVHEDVEEGEILW